MLSSDEAIKVEDPDSTFSEILLNHGKYLMFYLLHQQMLALACIQLCVYLWRSNLMLCIWNLQTDFFQTWNDDRQRRILQFNI